MKLRRKQLTQASAAAWEDFLRASAEDNFALQCFTLKDAVPCPFSPTALPLLGGPACRLVPVGEPSTTVLGAALGPSGVKQCCRKVWGEIRFISVFGKPKSAGIPWQKIGHSMRDRASCTIFWQVAARASCLKPSNAALFFYGGFTFVVKAK